ncbi:MAG: hypothetical protein ACKOYH_07040 [Cyanobium sp.]
MPPPATPRAPRRPVGRNANQGVALALLFWTSAAGAVTPLARAQDQPAERPPGLVLLVEKTSSQGPYSFGMFHPRPDPVQPSLWNVRIWQEVSDRVTVSSERLNCDRRAPMRILRQGSNLELRYLNPGGALTPSNRLDHLLWWAVCHPSLAGRDPAGLGAEAQRLGFSGQLVERLEIVPAGR